MKRLLSIIRAFFPFPRKRIAAAGIAAAVLITSAVFAYIKFSSPSTADGENNYVAFTAEVYQKIQENYWERAPDKELAVLFELAAEKLSEKDLALPSRDEAGVETLVEEELRSFNSDEKKREFVTALADIVLANLKPFGRSRLYSQKKEQELRETVANIDRSADLYETLGVDEEAPKQEIKQAYKQRKEGLEEKETAEAQQELAQVERAYETLGREESRKRYKESKVESSVVGTHLHPAIAYIKLKRMSPTTFTEFQEVAKELDKGKSDTLIFDLRGNIGGAIDILPYFLGPFIGPESYAYEFYRQGEREPFKTKIGWMPSLVRYKKVVVLVDENTQSSAEVMAGALKKYNVGVVVGAPTKGWGTVENTFPIETQMSEGEEYSLFLVHSITLRDDGQPIEGRGIDPLIYIDDPGWKAELLKYFEYEPLVEEVAQLVGE